MQSGAADRAQRGPLRSRSIPTRENAVFIFAFSTTLQESYNYDAVGNLLSKTDRKNHTIQYGYDAVSRLLKVLHQAGVNTLDGASYTYDSAGNRTAKTNYLNGVTSNYGYDPLYELTQVTQGGSTTESYSYDFVGNRLSSSGVPNYSYNSSNELTSNSSGSYSYDANGNTLSDPSGKSYTWDFENRLTQVVNPGVGTTTFRYDPFSILSERVDSTNNVISVVTLKGHPLAGWRYWRAYSIGTNDVVIETGGYDQPGPLPWNFAGYYLSQKTLSKGWKQYLQYIQTHLNAAEGTNLSNKLGGIQLAPYGSLLDGYWDYKGSFTNYILNNVCQSTSCN